MSPFLSDKLQALATITESENYFKREVFQLTEKTGCQKICCRLHLQTLNYNGSLSLTIPIWYLSFLWSKINLLPIYSMHSLIKTNRIISQDGPSRNTMSYWFPFGHKAIYYNSLAVTIQQIPYLLNKSTHQILHFPI